MDRKGKIIVVAAPSGCGKSTIINALLERGDLNLGFAVSATTRQPRGDEQHGVDLYLLYRRMHSATVSPKADSSNSRKYIRADSMALCAVRSTESLRKATTSSWTLTSTAL